MEKSFNEDKFQNPIISITHEDIKYILMTDGKYYYKNSNGNLEAVEDKNIIDELTKFTMVSNDER